MTIQWAVEVIITSVIITVVPWALFSYYYAHIFNLASIFSKFYLYLLVFLYYPISSCPQNIICPSQSLQRTFLIALKSFNILPVCTLTTRILGATSSLFFYYTYNQLRTILSCVSFYHLHQVPTMVILGFKSFQQHEILGFLSSLFSSNLSHMLLLRSFSLKTDIIMSLDNSSVFKTLCSAMQQS